MQPDISKVTIGDNTNLILEMLDDLLLRPRVQLIKWSRRTKQTPNVKIGYPGQHLASLVTGVEGSRTGARGHDLIDASEVKSCSRIDQLDKCRQCHSAVARLEQECPNCGSDNIKRNNDSKWLFGIRSEQELKLLTKDIDRILLMIGDHPNFDGGDYSTLRFQAFEIWPRNPRFRNFVALMENYYRKIYLGHKGNDPAKNPAPKNFWPYSFQFYMCNPVKVFSCTVTDAEANPRVSIDYFVDPKADRSPLAAELMPSALLNADETSVLAALPDAALRPLLVAGAEPSVFRTAALKTQKLMLNPLDELARKHLALRDTDVPAAHSTPYSRI